MFIVNAREGQSIQIADLMVHVLTVVRPGLVSLSIPGEPEPVMVSWDRKLEVFPDVNVTVDRATCYSHSIKFFFDAPRAVRIRELPYEPPQ